MKKEIAFKFNDSYDNTASVSYSYKEECYILTTGLNKVWLSPQDFVEFLDECRRFYQDNETLKNKQPEDEENSI